MRRIDCDNATCCQIRGEWYLLSSQEVCEKYKKEYQDKNIEMVAVTLPHNGKMIYCPKGVDAQVYNLSLEIQKTNDELEKLGLSIDESKQSEIESKLNQFISSNGCKY